MKKRTTKKWTMPAWMVPYVPLIAGGSDKAWVEEIMNDDGRNSNVFNNAPRALICVSIKGQVGLLTTLHQRRALTPDEKA